MRVLHAQKNPQSPDTPAQGEENMGMAMTFTLVSHLREQLAVLVKERTERRRKEEVEKERLALEVSEVNVSINRPHLDTFH